MPAQNVRAGNTVSPALLAVASEDDRLDEVGERNDEDAHANGGLTDRAWLARLRIHDINTKKPLSQCRASKQSVGKQPID